MGLKPHEGVQPESGRYKYSRFRYIFGLYLMLKFCKKNILSLGVWRSAALESTGRECYAHRFIRLFKGARLARACLLFSFTDYFCLASKLAL
jgi:hypothetical protein